MILFQRKQPRGTGRSAFDHGAKPARYDAPLPPEPIPSAFASLRAPLDEAGTYHAYKAASQTTSASQRPRSHDAPRHWKLAKEPTVDPKPRVAHPPAASAPPIAGATLDRASDSSGRSRFTLPARRLSLLMAGVAAIIAAIPISMTVFGGAGGGSRLIPVETLMRHASQAAARGDWPACIETYTLALEAAPADVAALRGRGACESSRGDSGAAASDYSRAISLDPTDPASLLARGQVNEQLGEVGQATADFERVVRMQAATAADAAAAVEGLRGLRLGSATVDTATSAVHRYPDAWQTYDELALAYVDAGSVAEALGEFKEAYSRSAGKDQAKVLADRAALFKSSGDLNGARADADRAVALDGRWEYLRLRAEIRQALGDLPGAVTDLSQAVTVERQSWWADATRVRIWLLDERGHVHVQMGQMAAARSDFSAALAITPADDAGTRAVLQAELAQASG